MASLLLPHFVNTSKLVFLSGVKTNTGRIRLSALPARFKSTTTTTEPVNEKTLAADKDVGLHEYSKDPLDLSFRDTKDAYKSKRTSEIIRALFVLKLSSFDFLVFNHSKLIAIGKKVLGAKLFYFIMKHTFYGQFVAGEDENEIRPVINHLKTFGVKSILDYSAEEDISEEQAVSAEMSGFTADKENENKQKQPTESIGKVSPDDDQLKQFAPQQKFADRRKFKVTARTYFYLNEAQCEKNTETFLNCIDAVAGVTDHTGLAAIKLTALGRPQILLQLSEVIEKSKRFFKKVTGVEKMILGEVTPEEFQEKLDKRFHIKTSDNGVRQWFDGMDYDQRGLMNLFSWNGLIDTQHLISDLFKVPNIVSGKMEPIISALSKEEEEMFRNMMRRIHSILKHATERDVRVMIDAEQTYLQPAINRITMEMMRKYNKEKAIVFNTYQAYLKKCHDNVIIDLELARRQNFYFGAKLVRGAYMTQESLRAKEVGYEDPIQPSYESTSNNYHRILEVFMKQIAEGIDTNKMSIMVASHNEDTVRFTVNKMKELGLRPEHKVICFGQLFGMCDHISFPLGQSGYSVYKYVPYGPVEEVLPYLSRRATENHDILEKSIAERGLLFSELKRRLFNGQMYHTPKGNYRPI